jgi:hypothetical protein
VPSKLVALVQGQTQGTSPAASEVREQQHMLSAQRLSPKSGAIRGVPLPRQRWQEEQILKVIRDLKYEPTMLPRRQSGKPWVKKEVRSKLDGPRWSASAFDKAWDRLRSDGRIKEKT